MRISWSESSSLIWEESANEPIISDAQQKTVSKLSKSLIKQCDVVVDFDMNLLKQLVDGDGQNLPKELSLKIKDVQTAATMMTHIEQRINKLKVSENKADI